MGDRRSGDASTVRRVTEPWKPPPFILPATISPDDVERHGRVDLYLPPADGPTPAVLVVHGGPIPQALQPTPRDWPAYRGYGALLADAGVVGAVVDHRLYSYADYPRAASDVADAVDLLRADPRVDADRIGIWVFSGSGPLLADWLAEPPEWLRVLAASYPILGPRPERDPGERFRPIEAVAHAGALPIVLTRVGREAPEAAVTVEEFVAAAGKVAADLRIIDVPDGVHGFDVDADTAESRDAVRQGLNAVLVALRH
jgi:acetyl esterase/lipase